MFGDDQLELYRAERHHPDRRTETPDPILPLRISFVEIVPRATSTKAKVREPIGTGPTPSTTGSTGRSCG